ncbi:MAG: chemotaxis protein CheW [Deltaproteobacteria bacterium]|nr:chemotaxis protein CheW [Deltaproteobacteria bacterium]
MQQTVGKSTQSIKELAIFQVGEMPCGLDTAWVREIIKNTQITKVHLAPDYVRGVINLRGEIATVIDLRKKFSLEPIEDDGNMEIVVVRKGTENIGILVDRVRDVIWADEKNITPPPSNISGVTGIFFEGIYKMERELVSILDIEELLKTGD